MTTILHLTTRTAWEQAKKSGEYRSDTLDMEGFIHASTPKQITRTANKFCAGKTGLVVLLIDQGKVRPEVRYEDFNAGDLFPHIYGPLNIDAVINILDIPPFEAGAFILPAEIGNLLLTE